MLSKILMPSGGQTTDEMTILKWNKQVGDPIKRGDILFEIETDKAILTVESFAEGLLLEIRYEEGASVKVGEVVALIGNKEEMKALEDKPVPPVQSAVLPAKQTAPPINHQPSPANKILASPLAKSLARVENIDLVEVSRFNAGMPIRKADISRFIAERKTPHHNGHEEADHYLMELTPIRRTIARRMKESLAAAPHFVISVDIDMTNAIGFRNMINARWRDEGRISFNDLLMKVVARAIKAAPLVNARFEENGIRVFNDVHIGLAVATETGIIVPVVKNVHRKTLSEIATANRINIEKVKTNRISESDMQGGTITISNLGMLGADWFTAIINQPESCILAIGAITKKVVVSGNQMVIRDIMNITGSFDHRVIDGAVGATFLQQVKELLQEPALLTY